MKQLFTRRKKSSRTSIPDKLPSPRRAKRQHGGGGEHGLEDGKESADDSDSLNRAYTGSFASDTAITNDEDRTDRLPHRDTASLTLPRTQPPLGRKQSNGAASEPTLRRRAETFDGDYCHHGEGREMVLVEDVQVKPPGLPKSPNDKSGVQVFEPQVTQISSTDAVSPPEMPLKEDRATPLTEATTVATSAPTLEESRVVAISPQDPMEVRNRRWIAAVKEAIAQARSSKPDDASSTQVVTEKVEKENLMNAAAAKSSMGRTRSNRSQLHSNVQVPASNVVQVPAERSLQHVTSADATLDDEASVSSLEVLFSYFMCGESPIKPPPSHIHAKDVTATISDVQDHDDEFDYYSDDDDDDVLERKFSPRRKGFFFW